MTALLKKTALWLTRLLGREFRDERTGNSLGRACVLPTPMDPSVVGFPHAVRPVFLPEKTTKYARHRLGFATHEEPDYPSRHEAAGSIDPYRLLWAILVHQSPAEVTALLRYWEKLGYSQAQILFVHGGKRDDFEALSVSHKVFVEDREIRTTFHPMEKQSYGGALREIAGWLGTEPGTHYEAVALVEYDHLPLIPDWGVRLCARLEEERADLLCHHLVRVDGTNTSHYLYHLSDPRFEDLWQGISVREEKKLFLNAIMTGSLWRRATLEAVAARRESFPVYLELYLPSLVHHLGFRVRSHGEQDRFVQVVPIDEPFSPKWRESGAWSLHQVKSVSSSF